ncbi:hypothetical protein ACRE5Y_24170, partial [Klebsiella pneumoniae]
MTLINCNKEMKGYHSEKVTLSNTDQSEMRDRRDNGRKRLENGLIRLSHPLPKDFSSQGSYAMRTMGHCCKVSDEAAFCLIQRPYISKTLLT